MSRVLLSVFFCAMAVGQTALAIAPTRVTSLQSLQQKDPNDYRTPAGRAYSFEKKATCSAQKHGGGRYEKTAAEQLAAVSGGATEGSGTAR